MRIALVILHADASRGGAERYTIDLADALSRGGHEVTLLAASFKNAPQRVATIELKATSPIRAGQYLKFLSLLDAHLATTSYDIVHAMLPVRRCDLYHPHAGIAAAFPTIRKKLESLFNPRRLLFAHIEKKLLAGPAPLPRVLCLSQAMRNEMKQIYALSDERLPILFNAVDLKKFAPSRRPERADRNRVNALIIANDFLRKGVHAAVFAMGRLRAETNLHLTVVGRDETVVTMKMLAQRQGVVNRVHFVGPSRDPRPHYESSDFFVLPTAHDPCSLVVLESLAMGLPVITTRINGASEVMHDGEEGFIIDSQADDAALADRMKQLLDQGNRERMARACLALRPKLSYETHLNDLLGIYESVIAGR